MKSQDLKLGVEYTIVSPHTYKSRSAREASACTRSQVFKGTLYDNGTGTIHRYLYDGSTSFKDSPSYFTKASPTAKTWGLLVQTFMPSGTVAYSVVRPVDVVADWASVEARWNTEETVEKLMKEQRDKADAQRKEQMAHINSRRESVEQLVKAEFNRLTGRNTDFQFDVQEPGGYRNPTIRARIVLTMDADELLHMVERMYERIDMAS
jgi:hypothetical protein